MARDVETNPMGGFRLPKVENMVTLIRSFTNPSEVNDTASKQARNISRQSSKNIATQSELGDRTENIEKENREAAKESKAERAYDMLIDHDDKEFVERILRPSNQPTLKNEDGTISTHSMATMEADGKHFVFPTVQRVSDGKVMRFEMEEAFERARKGGEAIPFDNAEDADWLAKHYKSIWQAANRLGE